MLTITLALSALAASIPGPELSPGTTYDSRIPSIRSVLGYEHGDEITTPENFVAYLKAVEAASGGRAKVWEYARTWEGRPLVVMAVGSADRIAKLDELKATMRSFANPSAATAATVEASIKSAPVVTWLLHGVHGNEISSGDAALAEAYHLLAAQNDPKAAKIMAESVVLIDPMQNPDGRARFIFQTLQGRAASPDSEPLSAEHDEPWPGGRSNHYLFDLNRDWLAVTQPETKGRVKLFLDFFPQVTVDLHEMGGDGTYYFPPAAAPKNPYRTPKQTEWLELFGRKNGERFDERGFAYFIREVFDSFYPGYGASWPMAQGSIAKTFEQASTRGLLWARRDGTTLTYKEAVAHHFTSAIETAHTAASNREALLRDFVAFRRAATDEGAGREYALLPGVDPSRSLKLAQLLATQGASVRRLTEAFTESATVAPKGAVAQSGATLPAGTYLIAAGQPTGRLVKNLLDPDVPMDPEFLKKQEDRRAQRLPDQFYDITAWSLPMLFDVDVVMVSNAATAKAVPFAGDAGSSGGIPAAKVAYMVPWGSGAAGAMAEASRSGLMVRFADDVIKLGGRTYPVGTAFLRVAENPQDLREKLQSLQARYNFDVIPTDTAFVEVGGISLGSNEVRAIKAPRVALLWDQPTSSLSAGWARFVLERQFGQPVSAIRTSSLRRVDLRKFDVVVMPSGDYSSAINDEGLRLIKDWVRGGGTLITIADASRWASRDRVGLLSTDTEMKDGKSEDATEAAKKPDPSKPFVYEDAIRPDRERPDVIAGAIMRVTLDREHWLTAGLDAELPGMVEGSRVFTPLKLDKGTNVGVYAEKDKLAMSGIVWKENKDALAKKAFLMHEPLGEGHVIAFAEEPNFRAYAGATQLLFMNAVLLGPAH